MRQEILFHGSSAEWQDCHVVDEVLEFAVRGYGVDGLISGRLVRRGGDHKFRLEICPVEAESFTAATWSSIRKRCRKLDEDKAEARKRGAEG